MQYIYAPMGLPASGKSTYFSESKWAGIPAHSADEIRVRLFGSDYQFTKENERRVWGTFNAEVRQSLSEGFDVIIDNTNLSVYAQKSLEKIAKEFDADIIYIDFTSVHMCESIRRNRARNNEYLVPDYVILDMCRKHLSEKFDEEIIAVCLEFPEVVRDYFREC